MTLVGFGAELARANPARLVYVDRLDRAVHTIGGQLATVDEVAAAAALDVARGRLHNIAGGTWAPQVVFVGPGVAGDALGEVLSRLRTAPGRLATALVVNVAGDDPTIPACRPALSLS